MGRSTRRIIQSLSLAVFIIILAIGRPILWMGLLAIGLVLSKYFGRFYCGWICPIHSGMEGMECLDKKGRLGSLGVPAIITSTVTRYLVFIAFLILFIWNLRTGANLPVLLILVGIGILLTLFFPAHLWHRYLCPYGTLFSVVSRRSARGLSIDRDKCTDCGRCRRVCPALAITETPKHFIHHRDCLLCLKCWQECPQNAIIYQ